MTGLSRGGWRILARTAQAAPAQTETRGGLRAAACDVRRRRIARTLSTVSCVRRAGRC